MLSSVVVSCISHVLAVVTTCEGRMQVTTLILTWCSVLLISRVRIEARCLDMMISPGGTFLVGLGDVVDTRSVFTRLEPVKLSINGLVVLQLWKVLRYLLFVDVIGVLLQCP